jgi:hypothetical protein
MQRNEAPGDLELVRRFVNTRDVEEGTDELDGPHSLLGWFSGFDLLDDEAVADEEDLKRVLALREGIRSLLLANNGEMIEPAHLRELDRVAESVCLRVRFDEDAVATLGLNRPVFPLLSVISWPPWCGPRTRGYGAG